MPLKPPDPWLTSSDLQQIERETGIKTLFELELLNKDQQIEVEYSKDCINTPYWITIQSHYDDQFGTGRETVSLSKQDMVDLVYALANELELKVTPK